MDADTIRALASAGGGVAVCLYLVKVFLDHIKDLHASYATKTEAALNGMADKFNAEHTATRVAFQAQIASMSDRVFEIAEKTTTAVNSLEVAIHDLQARIK
jgi:hypothetical protein